MSAFTYCPVERAVFWGTKRLRSEAVVDMLYEFEKLGERDAYDELHAAHVAAGGIPFVSSFRRAA